MGEINGILYKFGEWGNLYFLVTLKILSKPPLNSTKLRPISCRNSVRLREVELCRIIASLRAR